VENGKIILVDDFTGRLTPQRTLGAGMHQAVEAKEGVELTPPMKTIARMSYQKFFRLFQRISGLSGTAMEVKKEMWRIYELPVVSIPTYRPEQRTTLPLRIFSNNAAKQAKIIATMHEVNATGQPLLIGTRSIKGSEELSEQLAAKNLPFELLNAVLHRQEAEIVAKAGQKQRITIATNMAGRGTDIKLSKGIKTQGGLFVLATEMHESPRIDRQLFGRCARQGDPGTVHMVVSIEDDLPRRYLPQHIRAILTILLHFFPRISQPLARELFRYAQYRAENMALKRRSQVLAADAWLDQSISFGQTDW
jgi:preprotein translocase subunit SecA